MANDDKHHENCDAYEAGYWISMADKELGETPQAGQDPHLASCASCRAEFESAKALLSKIEGALDKDAITPSPGAREHILSLVNDRVPAGVPLKSPGFSYARLRTPLFWVAAASILFLCIGLGSFFLTDRQGGPGEEAPMSWEFPKTPLQDSRVEGASQTPTNPLPEQLPTSTVKEVEKPKPPTPATPSVSPKETSVEVTDPVPGAKEIPSPVRETFAFSVSCDAGQISIRDGSSPSPAHLCMQGDLHDAKTGTAEFTAETGLARITLGGNTVSLNQGARGSLRYFRDAWELTLESGEVYCEVDPAKKQGFSVVTPHGVAMAKGTAFFVRVEGESAIVSVTKGRVRVSSMNQNSLLGKGQASELTPGNPPQVRTRAQKRSSKWLKRLDPHPLVQLHGTPMRRRAGKHGVLARAGKKRNSMHRRAHRRLSAMHRRGRSAASGRARPKGQGKGAGGRRGGGGRQGGGNGGGNGGGRNGGGGR